MIRMLELAGSLLTVYNPVEPADSLTQVIPIQNML